MLAAVERPARGTQEPRAPREVAVGADGVSRRGGDVPAVVVHEVDPALDAGERRLEAVDRERPRALLGRAGGVVAPEPRNGAAELGAQLLRIAGVTDLRLAAVEVALDRRARARRAAAGHEEQRERRRRGRAHQRVASSSAASIHVLAAAKASGSLDLTTTSTSAPSSPEAGYETTSTPG